MAIPGSMLIWMAFLPLYATVAPKLNFSMEYSGVLVRLFASPVFWVMGLVLPVLCLLRDFAWK
jgi:phospholipid-transporting ATPase